MDRRDFIAKAAFGAAILNGLSSSRGLGQGQDELATPIPGNRLTPRDFLESILYTKQEVHDWLEEKAFPFSRYSSEFGWLCSTALFQDGVDDSVNDYTYGAFDERIMVNYRDRPCRINSYGDSFTQCHQVSDGETWQEVLAAHLKEPVRNFGIGGWSVYQAYLRMLYEETRVPADCIIIHIHEDDHLRNLDAWRNIRSAKSIRSINPTLPYLRVDLKQRLVEEQPNLCPTPESVYNLCDLDWVIDTFEDDFSLQITLTQLNATTKNPEHSYADAMNLATTHGMITRIDTAEGLSETADALFHQAGQFASEWIVEKAVAFAQDRNKKILFVLSYPAQRVARYLSEGVRPDQQFFDFMTRKGYPMVDLLTVHGNDFSRYQGEIIDYLRQYYIGHYNPRGCFFAAFAMKDSLVELLDPKPLAYRPPPGILRKPPKTDILKEGAKKRF